MIEPWIIEKIKEEKEKKEKDNRIQIILPVPEDVLPSSSLPANKDDIDRGIIIINL